MPSVCGRCGNQGHPQGVPLRKNYMAYDRDQHHRRSIRLKGYDYSQSGAYFVTICLQHRAGLFGRIIDKEMRLNAVGSMLDVQWNALPDRFAGIQLDEYIVMPNHFHGIIVMAPHVGDLADAQHNGDIIGAFKSITTHEYVLGVKHYGWPSFDRKLWQRNYYEHIIRNEKSLCAIREYIANNPINWQQDELFYPM